MDGDVPQRTRRLLLILPGILMGFTALCLLTAYFCVTQSQNQTETPYNRSRIHEETDKSNTNITECKPDKQIVVCSAPVPCTLNRTEHVSDRSPGDEGNGFQKFLLVASHDGHRTWNHVTVDGTDNTVEVEVPTFGQFQQSIIIYDFEEGFMANKDIVGERCFIKRIHEYLENSMKNLDSFKGVNLTIHLEDVLMNALPGVIPPALLRSTAGDRLADMCTDLTSYWLVQPTIKNKGSNQKVMTYDVQNGPMVPVEKCDVRVADILSASLLCVQLAPNKNKQSLP